MKKVLVIIALSISVIACDKKAEVKEVKTAYVDTSKLMSEYTEAKDLEAKYKAQAEEKGRLLEAEINRFKQEASNFQSQAQANGQAWAQQKGAELQKREQQLGYAQQQLSQQQILVASKTTSLENLSSELNSLKQQLSEKDNYSNSLQQTLASKDKELSKNMYYKIRLVHMEKEADCKVNGVRWVVHYFVFQDQNK
jgi:outer membrane protein